MSTITPKKPTTASDLPNAIAHPATITVYGPEVCPRCDSTMKQLDRHGIAATKIIIEPGDENYAYVTAELGYMSAPVVILEAIDAETLQPVKIHWNDHRMDMLMGLKTMLDRS